MQTHVLFHIPRERADYEAGLAWSVVSDAVSLLKGKLVRLPTHSLGGTKALPDLESDEVICIQHVSVMPEHITALRMAVHHRHRPQEHVKKKLRGTILGLDESRIKTGWKFELENRKKKNGRTRYVNEY